MSSKLETSGPQSLYHVRSLQSSTRTKISFVLNSSTSCILCPATHFMKNIEHNYTPHEITVASTRQTHTNCELMRLVLRNWLGDPNFRLPSHAFTPVVLHTHTHMLMMNLSACVVCSCSLCKRSQVKKELGKLCVRISLHASSPNSGRAVNSYIYRPWAYSTHAHVYIIL